RQHAARGVDADELVLPAPSVKRRTHIVEDLAEQFSRKISLPPDSSLNRFERRRFAVSVHQPVNIVDRRLDLFGQRLAFERGRVKALSDVSGLFSAQLRQIRLNLRGLPVAAEIVFNTLSREREKRHVNEIYRRRRTFDVQ